ncbi:MAG: glycosyltransferase family 2 protein [Candidatus Margulisbacteria bacterium]|nr:glycosyltransferase family 2 protein [Candidatus Margulisiibacteriota bacterium]
MPVYNELKTILQAIKDVDKITIPDKEVIVIDNCSTDGTRELLRAQKEVGYRVIYNERNLVCGTFVVGLKAAQGEYLYVHHSDLEYDPTDALTMLKVAEEGGYDLVLGSRLQNDRRSKWEIIKERPAYLASIICTWLINRWYGKSFTDIIGTRLYRTASVKKVPITTTTQGFDFEHVSRMCRMGYKIAEVPIAYKARSSKEGKKVKPWHMLNALFAMFRVRIFG